jgi:hypothetical protein
MILSPNYWFSGLLRIIRRIKVETGRGLDRYQYIRRECRCPRFRPLVRAAGGAIYQNKNRAFVLGPALPK